MNIAIVGAGIIGITTAYELAADGHQVTVFERRGAAAEEASFANPGVISPGYITPFSAPIELSLPATLAELGWLWRHRRARRPKAQAQARERLQRLAYYSRQRLLQLSESLNLAFERSPGRLVLLRSGRDSRELQPQLAQLREAGVALRELTPEAARQVEPALNAETALHAAIHLPDDEASNCRQFALLLKNEAQRLGASFEFNRPVQLVRSGQGVAVQVPGVAAPRAFDQVVVCAGADASALLRPLGVRVRVVGVHGYSVSASVREMLNAPRGTVLDERHQVTVSRLGNRVRVAGSAEIGRASNGQRAATLKKLYRILHDWFPGAAQLSSGIQEWRGASPMTPDGPPIIGTSGLPGLWLNLGHGVNGWALACGSARALADLMAGHTPAVSMEGLGLKRR